jgi:hypothetical protein
MVALSLVRLLFILHGLLDQHGQHIDTISTNIAIVNHNITCIVDTRI